MHLGLASSERKCCLCSGNKNHQCTNFGEHLKKEKKKSESKYFEGILSVSACLQIGLIIFLISVRIVTNEQIKLQTSEKRLPVTHMKSAWHQSGLCGCSLKLREAAELLYEVWYLSVQVISHRHRGKNQTELFIWRILHTGKIIFQKLQLPCFAVKSETPRCISCFWYIRLYLSPSDACNL